MEEGENFGRRHPADERLVGRDPRDSSKNKQNIGGIGVGGFFPRVIL